MSKHTKRYRVTFAQSRDDLVCQVTSLWHDIIQKWRLIKSFHPSDNKTLHVVNVRLYEPGAKTVQVETALLLHNAYA